MTQKNVDVMDVRLAKNVFFSDGQISHENIPDL